MKHINLSKLKRALNSKDMNLGNNLIISIFIISFCINPITHAEEKILSSPLINLEKLKPSFEEEDPSKIDLTKDEIFEKKNQTGKNGIKSEVKLIGLDKITAKTSEIKIKLGETKLFGPLEIKVLKCGKIESGNKDDHVAYLQVKDLSEDQSEQVFIFNGWTFSSDPSITPFDHAIYDIQLVNCNLV